MSNSFFQFKQFTIHQDKCAMKVTTDASLFGAWAANEIKSKQGELKNILDIGTGTGLLPMMIAQQNEQLFMDAIEIDKEAFQQSTENVSGSIWKNRINIMDGDAKNFLFNKQYDCIISNPPFYENELASFNAKKNTAHHSSELTIDDLLILIKANLAPSGSFYLLLPFKREKEINQLFQSNQLFISKEVFVRQTIKHDYFRILIAGTQEKQNEIERSELSIRNDREEYTNEFTQLLKEYYLHL